MAVDFFLSSVLELFSAQFGAREVIGSLPRPDHDLLEVVALGDQEFGLIGTRKTWCG